MVPDYADIRRRIAEPPVWFDQHGVPRYDAFTPGMTNIYAEVSALLEIACQGCTRTALVGCEYDKLELFDMKVYTLPGEAHSGSFHYGDFPRLLGPNGQDCCSGVTMTTEVLRVVEFWLREGSPIREWVRHPEYEWAYPSSEGATEA